MYLYFTKINSIILVRLIGKVRKQWAGLIVQLSINYFIVTGVTIKNKKVLTYSILILKYICHFVIA